MPPQFLQIQIIEKVSDMKAQEDNYAHDLWQKRKLERDENEN